MSSQEQLVTVFDQEDPWGPGLHQVSVKETILDQKLWCASAIINKHQTAKSLSIRLDLSAKRLRKWAKVTRNGNVFKKEGRPPKIGPAEVEESNEAMCAWLGMHAGIAKVPGVKGRRDPARGKRRSQAGQSGRRRSGQAREH